MVPAVVALGAGVARVVTAGSAVAGGGSTEVGGLDVGTVVAAAPAPAGSSGVAGWSRRARASTDSPMASTAATARSPRTSGVRSRPPRGGAGGGGGAESTGSAAVAAGSTGAATVSTTGRGWVSVALRSTNTWSPNSLAPTPSGDQAEIVTDVGVPPSERTRLRRHPERGRYDEATVHAVLDEGLVAHVGVVTDRGPLVLPMAYGRVGGTLYLHGAAGNALLRAAEDGPVCATVTLLDGLVLARSAFHHSMNFRAVVVFGTARRVIDEGEQRLALDAIVDKVAPGRAAEARPPTPAELRSTRVLALDLAEASAKVRTGPPVDDAADAGWPAWSGTIALTLVRGTALEA